MSLGPFSVPEAISMASELDLPCPFSSSLPKTLKAHNLPSGDGPPRSPKPCPRAFLDTALWPRLKLWCSGTSMKLVLAELWSTHTFFTLWIVPISSLGPYSQPAQAYAVAFPAPITLGNCSKLTVINQLPRCHHPWLLGCWSSLVKSNWKGVTSQTYSLLLRKAVTKLCSGLPGLLLKVLFFCLEALWLLLPSLSVPREVLNVEGKLLIQGETNWTTTENTGAREFPAV